MLRARNALGYGSENRIELANIAISEIRAFLKSNKNDLDALLDLGVLLKEINELDEAISCYERALEVDPENQTALRLLAWAYTDKGLDDKARSLRVNTPQDPDGFHPRVSDPDVRRAWASADNGNFEKAAIHMEKALKHFPDDGHNWETLEYYYAASGQYEKAESCRHK